MDCRFMWDGAGVIVQRRPDVVSKSRGELGFGKVQSRARPMLPAR